MVPGMIWFVGLEKWSIALAGTMFRWNVTAALKLLVRKSTWWDTYVKMLPWNVHSYQHYQTFVVHSSFAVSYCLIAIFQIYLLSGIRNNTLLEFVSLQSFADRITSPPVKVVQLPFYWQGTGHVVYGGFLYTHKANTPNQILKVCEWRHVIKEYISVCLVVTLEVHITWLQNSSYWLLISLQRSHFCPTSFAALC